MNKIYKLILFFLLVLLTNCSLDSKSGIWTGKKKIVQEEVKLIKLTIDEDLIDREFNPNLLIKLKKDNISNQQWLFSDINLSNLIPHLRFEGSVKKFSKYKFKRVIKRKLIEPDLIIGNDFVIFYDNNGSILKFNKNSKLQWKTKIYNKKERNKVLNISLALSKNLLFVTDNLGNFYNINVETGKLGWKKSNKSMFNSQLKIINNKIFTVDTDNSLWCFSAKDGTVLWNINTEKSLIKTFKKLSLIVYKNSVIFSNSIGDITRVDLQNGDLIWQVPTQNSLAASASDFLKSSDLVLYKNSVLLSNNNNELYSIDANSGIINWIQNVNSYLRPIIIEDLIFTVTDKGFLVVVNSSGGQIIRANYLLNGLKKKIKRNISFEGFIIASNKIFITTNNGRLLVYSVLDGKLEKVYKVGKFKLSEPFINNNNLYVIRSNAVVVLN